MAFRHLHQIPQKRVLGQDGITRAISAISEKPFRSLHKSIEIVKMEIWMEHWYTVYSVFIVVAGGSEGVCWMEHLELELEVHIWWFCSTHEYCKITKYQLHSPTLSAPSRFSFLRFRCTYANWLLFRPVALPNPCSHFSRSSELLDCTKSETGDSYVYLFPDLKNLKSDRKYQ